MRPFAAVLSIRRGKSEAGSITSTESSARFPKTRSPSLFSKAPKHPVHIKPSNPPPPPSNPLLTPGSSSSSDGSVNLQTPEDDGIMVFPRNEEKKKKATWFGWRKTSDKVFSEEPAEIHQDVPIPRNISTVDSRQPPPRINRQSASDTDDDEASTAAESSDELTPTLTTSKGTKVPPESLITRSQSHLRMGW